jgi:hypothetical protein
MSCLVPMSVAHSNVTKSSRVGDWSLISEITTKKTLPKLTAMYPSAGALYVLSNPSGWRERDLLKFGKSKNNDLKRRFHNYSTANPPGIEPKLIILCKDVDRLEDHVKMFVGPYLIDQTHLEWVRMPLADLERLILRFVQKDEMLSKELGHAIYSFVSHDCRQCFEAVQQQTPLVTSLSSLPAAASADDGTATNPSVAAAPSFSDSSSRYGQFV